MKTIGVAEPYDHYVAVDWSQQNMAIAVLSRNCDKPRVLDARSDVSELKMFLGTLKGRKVLTIEESSPAQWLYTELREHVDRLIICDPCRNRLLQEGPKNDAIDAEKLVLLLRSGLLKEVFHSGSEFFRLRKLASGYNDIVRSMVRFKNQRAALLLAEGKPYGREGGLLREGFSFEALNALIKAHEEQLEKFTTEFKRLRKTNKAVRILSGIPGIKEKSAVKLAALVVDIRRFENKGHWLSYCGLVRHQKRSGGKSYGSRRPRYSRQAKSIFKTAAVACIGHGGPYNPFRNYYQRLRARGLVDYNARHAVARRIAVLAFGVLKTGLPFKDRWGEKIPEQ